MSTKKRRRPVDRRTTHQNNTAATANSTLKPFAFGPDHEPSAWLRGVEAARLAEIDSLGLHLDPDVLLVSALVDADIIPGSKADRTCDRCATYVVRGAAFYPLTSCPRPGVVLIGGLCEPCTRLEVGA